MATSGATHHPGVRTKIQKEKNEKLERLLLLQTALYNGIRAKFKGAGFITDEEAAKITHGKAITIAKKIGNKLVGCKMVPLSDGGMAFSLVSNEPQSLQVLKESIDEYVKSYNTWRDKNDKEYELSFELEVDKIEEIKPLLEKLEPGIKIERISVKDSSASSGFRSLTTKEVNDIRKTLPTHTTPSTPSTTRTARKKAATTS